MKYGFIGCGNMGSAIALSLSKTTRDLIITDRSGKARALAQQLGCTYGSSEEAAGCDRVFLAVKPQMMEAAVTALRPMLQAKKPALITMAAGLEMAKIESFAGIRLPVIRIMPNTPVAVGKGVILYCRNDLVDDAMLEDFLQDLQYAGRLEAVEEPLMDAAGTVSGCGPAYAYLFLEAMADGAVACGVPRAAALRLAAATLEGAAQMILTTGRHPGVLKDEVCSPGGSTIAGVKALEEHGFRGAVMDCIAAAFQRNRELGK